MRNLIMQEFLSVDGMAAGKDGNTDFIPASTRSDQSFGRRQESFLDSIDTMLLGRKTYEMFSSYWPKVRSGEDKEFADKLNALNKVVFSKTLDRAPWGDGEWEDATTVKTDAAREVERLKQQPGKDLVIWGSLTLAQSLIHEGLIDEFQLIVCPVVLVEGRKLFDDHVAPGEMHLLSTRSFDRGAVLLSYAGEMVASAR
jgi:dihydrofolate reductase